MNGLWDWDAAWAVLPELLLAFVQVTLIVTVLSTAIAAVLGLFIAILRMSVPKPVAAVITFIGDFIRMTPIVVQLLFAYWTFLTVEPLTIGIVVFGIHYSTYMAEVYRAGIDSVHPSQEAAARSLGLTRGQSLRFVVLPPIGPTVEHPFEIERRPVRCQRHDHVDQRRIVGLRDVPRRGDGWRSRVGVVGPDDGAPSRPGLADRGEVIRRIHKEGDRAAAQVTGRARLLDLIPGSDQ